MVRLYLLLGFCMSIGSSDGALIETKRYYHVESSDGSFITIGGDNSGGVKVITEDNHGTDPRQAFWVGEGRSHELMPQAQNALSRLLLAEETKSNLIIQQSRGGWFARHQWWIINDLGDNKWHIQNVESGKCMSSNG